VLFAVAVIPFVGVAAGELKDATTVLFAVAEVALVAVTVGERVDAAAVFFAVAEVALLAVDFLLPLRFPAVLDNTVACGPTIRAAGTAPSHYHSRGRIRDPHPAATPRVH